MNSLKRMERERNQRIRVLAEKENVLAAIPINKIIGIAESRKKKARFPDKTETTGFLISLNISKQNFLKF